MPAPHFDAVIVGAGAIGAACALALAKARPQADFAIIEQKGQVEAELGQNQRVWALGQAATTLLADLGVLQDLPAAACHPYEHMVVWDEQSDGQLDFHAADLDLSALGHMVDADYCSALLQAQLQEQTNVHTFFEQNIEGISFGAQPRIELASQTLSAALIIAADGSNSWVRNQAKIFAPAQQYEQKGVVAKITTECSHQNTAWQRFLSTGPVAVLPLANEQSSIVWSTTHEHAQELVHGDVQEFEMALADALEQRLGTVTLLGDRLSFPLQSRQAEKYVQKGVVLIGDAAHSIHPLAGQGANLGFQDVQALVDVLAAGAEFGREQDLKKYQRLRRPANLQADFMMTSLHHAYRLNEPLWALLRGRGMNWVSQSQILKTWLARQAIGL